MQESKYHHAKIVACRLFIECSFSHANGKLYRDDALDTWALLYEDITPWQSVEAELETMFGEDYAVWGYLAHLKNIED